MLAETETQENRRDQRDREPECHHAAQMAHGSSMRMVRVQRSSWRTRSRTLVSEAVWPTPSAGITTV